jgi:hypothetical protein
MPNWCSNELKIIGPPHRLAELSYLVSLPVMGQIDVGTRAIDTFPFGCLSDVYRLSGALRLNSISPVPHKLGDTSVAWGTKWDVSELELEISGDHAPYATIDFQFQTSDRGPFPVIQLLSRRFSDVGMWMSSREDGNDYFKTQAYFGGVLLFEKDVAVSELEVDIDESDYDPDEFMNQKMRDVNEHDARNDAIDAAITENESEATGRLEQALASLQAGPGSAEPVMAAWPAALVDLNQHGPNRFAAGISGLRAAGDGSIDRFLALLRQPSGYGAIDAILSWPAEPDDFPYLQGDRLRELAALCAMDDDLARVVGSEHGRLMNGIHSVCYMARHCVPETPQASGVRNIFKHASFALDTSLSDSSLENQWPGQVLRPFGSVKTAGRVLTSGALVASCNPDAWDFLREKMDGPIDRTLIASSVQFQGADRATALEYFGAAFVAGRILNDMTWLSDESRAFINGAAEDLKMVQAAKTVLLTVSESAANSPQRLASKANSL